MGHSAKAIFVSEKNNNKKPTDLTFIYSKNGDHTGITSLQNLVCLVLLLPVITGLDRQHKLQTALII